MKLKPFLALMLGLLLWGCAKENIAPNNSTPKEVLSKKEINDFVRQQLEREDRFLWSMANDQMIWSAAVLSDSIISLGYQPAQVGDISDSMHKINLKDEQWTQVKTRLIKQVVDYTNQNYPGQNYSAADLMPFGENEFLPVINIRIWDENLITALRNSPEIRYVEPIGYDPEEIRARDAGCDNSPASSINPADFTTVSPNAKVPWNFYNMNIPSAWSTSTGDGVRVAVIDSGVSSSQAKLNSQFNNGLSQGRSLSKASTLITGWWWWASNEGPNDQCGHGTAMAGLVGGPRGTTGSTTGVAYNADLLTIRATNDVIISGSNETNGVSDAIVMAGNTSDVKILSMSIGSIFSSGQITDAINYTYGRGKMIIAAAGTSTSFTNWYGVIFPAWLSKTVAVTGIKEGTPLTRCNICHSGSAVDFVAPMQRRNDNSRTSLTLAMSGNSPSNISGSSAATATTAGVAALIWATNPSMSRATVLNKMKSAASIYPSRNSQFGWGIIDAQKAVR
ncbi:MAG: S8 family serine peptidase [Bacteroidota bacterium]